MDVVRNRSAIVDFESHFLPPPLLFDPGSDYSVMLDRLRQQRETANIATLHGQHPTSPVTLEIMVDSDQLAPGTYSLRVIKQASDEEALDFIFEK